MVKSLSVFIYRIFIMSEDKKFKYWLTGQVAASTYDEAMSIVGKHFEDEDVIEIRVESTNNVILVER